MKILSEQNMKILSEQNMKILSEQNMKRYYLNKIEIEIKANHA